MNILLTNAEGYDAPGIAALRSALILSGFNVLTVAPAAPQVRLSKAISDREPVLVERSGGDDRHPLYRVHGTAPDCVRIAILSGLASQVSAVVVGIGEEANVGEDASNSSTLGAALEGGMLGYPAMAISQQAHGTHSCCGSRSTPDFAWASAVGAELAAWLAASPPPDRSVLNINVPAHLADRHIKLTSFSECIWEPLDCQRANVESEDSWLVQPHANGLPRFAKEPGSDAWALDKGHVSVTPLSFDRGIGRSAVRLRAWTRSIIQQVDPRLGATEGACSAGCCG